MWINLGGHRINLDQIVDIITDETRINWSTHTAASQPEPCVIFVRPVAQVGEHGQGGSEEIQFFGAQREAIVAFLDKEVCPPASRFSIELPDKAERPQPVKMPTLAEIGEPSDC